MPWKVTAALDQRMRFVVDYETGNYTIAELCRHYGVSRPTGYKILERYGREGVEGLRDQTRAPKHHPNQVPQRLVQQILQLRRQRPSWGARKLLGYLQREYPHILWPAPSTVGELLHREGLASSRPKRRRTPPYTQPFAAIAAPNQVWCADFKGWFYCADHRRIDPFTLTDAYSRYLLRCQAVDDTDTAAVQAILVAAFREYGMPWALRTDNGAPFASRAIAGLSRLAVFLMKLGIAPERIRPGHPEQNGRHERMHRTLQAEAASPPAANRRAQQRAFDRFRRDYNEVRPHAALGQETPASCYVASGRRFPDRLPEPEYASHLQVRRVQGRGEFYWKGHKVFLSETLIGENIGLESVEENYWLVYFATFPIACFDDHELAVSPLPEPEAKA